MLRRGEDRVEELLVLLGQLLILPVAFLGVRQLFDLLGLLPLLLGELMDHPGLSMRELQVVPDRLVSQEHDLDRAFLRDRFRLLIRGPGGPAPRDQAGQGQVSDRNRRITILLSTLGSEGNTIRTRRHYGAWSLSGGSGNFDTAEFGVSGPRGLRDFFGTCCPAISGCDMV